MTTPTIKRKITAIGNSGGSGANPVCGASLNSLANGASVVCTDYNGNGVISNYSGDSCLEGCEKLSLVLTVPTPNGSATTTYTNAYVALWFLKAQDGTNYDTGGASVTPGDVQINLPVTGAVSVTFRETFEVDAEVFTAAKILVQGNLTTNGAANSFAANGNTIALYGVTTTIPSV